MALVTEYRLYQISEGCKAGGEVTGKEMYRHEGFLVHVKLRCLLNIQVMMFHRQLDIQSQGQG